ncbi:50S ribosomal protein L22 [candidate division TA06 bacterium B3_TA06]|uniref:Large ribosomal subunit protein uL22 n=1 Tax=candidate division TA06 bacterium B3_TA06 TaxID=2012487 RepID=A0A532V464_UNCT6|nr:MAG: 50S ribosomal protein L22 [candidate division TA06 bacterium B3_TA06]
MSEVIARARFVRGSAKKFTRILGLIRGRQVDEALRILAFLNKPSKEPILKTLRSAIANAESRLGKAKFERQGYFVVDARADTGPIMRRLRAAPRGRGVIIRKRFAHLTVKISDEKRTE